MSLATDANISRLQQMFPSVEGDVIAIVLNDCGNNVEKCINHLLEISGEDSSSGSAPKQGSSRQQWPSVSQSSAVKKPNKRQQGKSQKPHTNKQGRQRGRPPQTNPPRQRGETQEGGREGPANPGAGVARQPLLVAPPPRAPVGFHPQTRPPENWGYYPSGQPIYATPPLLHSTAYGMGTDQRGMRPRMVPPPAIAHRLYDPNGQPRGVVPFGPNGPPVVRGGILVTPSGISLPPHPRGVMHMAGVGIPMRSGGIPLAYGGTPVVLSGPTIPNNNGPQNGQQRPMLNNYRTGISGSPVSDFHSPVPTDRHQTGWPIEIESESGTKPGNGTPHQYTESSGLDEGEFIPWRGNSCVAKRLVLLRGLPGSGKSTLGRSIADESGVICSTDDFFYRDGKYVFDPGKLGEYHDRNKERAKEAMLNGLTPVIIDNTNLSAWEMKPYVETGLSLGYKIEIVEPTTQWRFDCCELARRNCHGVPQDKIEKMLERYEHSVTVDAILHSQTPSRERRRENGRGGHMTSHMTPTHPHYGRRPPHRHTVSPQHLTHSNTSQPSPSILPQSGNCRHPSLSPSQYTVTATHLHPLPSPTSHSSHPHTSHPSPTALTHTNPSVGAFPVRTESRKTQSLSPALATTDPLALSLLSGLTENKNKKKEEEEEEEAKMSKIWGEGRLSDDIEGVGWRERVWGGDGGPENTTASLSWDQLPVGGTVWSGLDPVGGGVGSDTIGGSGLVGRPLPCEFGPIGKRSSELKIDTTKKSNTGTTASSEECTPENNTTTSVSPHDITNSLTSREGRGRSESPVCAGEEGPGGGDGNNRSASAELWVSADTDNWPCYNEHSNILWGDEEGDHTHSAETPPTGKLITSDQSTPAKVPCDSPSLEDPAIITVLTESGASGDVESHWREEGVPECEVEEPLFAPANTETSPEKRSSNHSPSPCLSLLLPRTGTTVSPLLTSPLLTPSLLTPSLLTPSLLTPSLPSPAHNNHTHNEPTDARSDNTTVAPTDAYFNGSVAPITNSDSETPVNGAVCATATEAIHTSSPTVVPELEEEEDEEEIEMEGGMVLGAVGTSSEYFPSAFESDRHPLVHGESPENDVTITSLLNPGSVTTGHTDSSSMSPSESGVRRKLWPTSGEGEGEGEGEGVALNIDSVQETSVHHMFLGALPPEGEREGPPHPPSQHMFLGAPPPEGEREGPPHPPSQHMFLGAPPPEGEREGPPHPSSQHMFLGTPPPEGEREGPPHPPSQHMFLGTPPPEGEREGSPHPPSPQSDLNFLVECFPDLSKQFLKLLLEKSGGNVEEAVSTALVSSIVSPTEPRSFQWSPPGMGGAEFWGCGLANESSGASVASESELEGGGEGLEDECVDDEEIAKIVQEQLNQDTSCETSGKETSSKKGERGGKEDDDNLVLGITRSLAAQLQQMFGSVDSHLPVEGELRDEDLKVLLSERAAQQIWQKWIDTLEAKKVEILLRQTSSISRAHSSPLTKSGSDSKPPERSSTEPEPLTEIMSEQTAQLQSTREVYNTVMAVCNTTIARKMKLQKLYTQFRALSRDTINYILLTNNFNFTSATTELEREMESTYGSHTGPTSSAGTSQTSFAGTTAKMAAISSGPEVRLSGKARSKAETASNKQPLRDKEVSHSSFQALEDSPSYDDLRAEAALHAKLRSEAFQKAARARSLRQGEVAVYYALKGHSHTEKMKEANRRAAALILQLHNVQSSQYLDLHGLYVDEALEALRERLQSTTGDGVLHVITGKGLHSKGEARIKPAVIHYLTGRGLTFEEMPGRLKVKLN